MLEGSASSDPDKLSAPIADIRPPARPVSPTVEALNPDLGTALSLVSLSPTAENHRRLAAEYRNAGILDKAVDHFRDAIRLEPKDGWAYEGVARIWRDWGFPQLGLGDAHRAVYFLPDAPEPLNTLGTILYALGYRREARARFEQALGKKPNAVYALNNLCYVALEEGDFASSRATCGRALTLAPRLAAARNNLALTYAAEGDLAAAVGQFSVLGDTATVQYNLGVVYLATGRYREAASAFEEAARLRPTLPFVSERVRQALALAGGMDGRH
jgi:tetratricopeptide (TPR) repeat protein